MRIARPEETRIAAHIVFPIERNGFERETEALRALKTEADQLDARRREHVGPLLEEIVGALEIDAGGLGNLLKKWEAQNVYRFELQQTQAAVIEQTASVN